MGIAFLLQRQDKPAMTVRQIRLQPLPGEKQMGFWIFEIDPVPIFANFLKIF